MTSRVLVAVLLLTSTSSAARAWDNVKTHRELTRASLSRANSGAEIDRYFQQALGLASIEDPRLPLVIGYDGKIDEDIGPKATSDDGSDLSRLNCSLNETDGICDKKRIHADDRIRMSAIGCDGEPGGEADSCDRYSVAKLLRVGSYAEDSPNPRASSHFFDPNSGTGLDDTTLLLAGIDVLGADLVTAVGYGGTWLRFLSAMATAPFAFFDLNVGNFDLDGDPASDWALGTSGQPDNFIVNRFSSVDAERYLFRALTAPTPLERDHYLGLHVLAVGHVAHVLEDMANPAHTRNDFMVDHVWYRDENLEVEGRQSYALDLVEAASISDDATLHASLPGAFITSSAIQPVLAAKNPAGLPAYATTLPSQTTTDFDLRDFWESAAGLAPLSHDRFFSGGSSSGQFNSPGRPGCPRDPNLPVGQPVPPPDDGVYLARLPGRDPASRFDLEEEPGTGEKTQFFYSSALVPHLANCRYHSLPRRQAQVTGSDFHWGATTIDESVKRDYVEILLPLTVDYTAKFLRHYFQTRIELVPLGGGEFKLRNLTGLPFEANLEDVEVAFDTLGGSRRSLPVACDGGTLAMGPNTGPGSDAVSTASCQLPDASADSDPSSAPKDPGEFWVVVRGRLGTRGDPPASSTLSDDWKDGDYVTAFARSTNAVVYQAQPPPFGEVGLSPAQWDGLEQADFYRSPVDLAGTVDPNGASTSAENLTAHLRTADVDDFRKPAVSPASGRIALMTDVSVDPSYQNYMTTESPELPGVLIPLNPLGLRAFAGVIDPSSDSGEATLRILGAREDDVGQLPVWLVGAEAFFARRTIAGNPADDLALYDAESGAELPHPILDNFPVTGTAASLVLADDGDPARGCGLSGDDLLAAKQDTTHGRLFAANVNCLQTVDAEGGGWTYGAPHFGGQLVLLDAQGQPIEALMIDADDVRPPEVRSCAGGCDFDGFTTPGLQHASFSPSTTKLAFVVGKVGAFTERGNRIFVYDYQTRQLMRIPEPQECVQGWVTWLPAGDRIAYLAYGDAPCSPTSEGAQLYVLAADGSETAGRAVTNFKDGWRRGNPSWWSPLRLPAAAATP